MAKKFLKTFRAQELCESRGGRPVLPVPDSPYGLCGRKAALNSNSVAFRPQERCESRGGCLGLPSPNSPYGLCGRKATLNSKLFRRQASKNRITVYPRWLKAFKRIRTTQKNIDTEGTM